MKIFSVHLQDYKSILHSGGIELHDNINIFAGKNNTGKTAFIESIYSAINGKPYNNSSILNEPIFNIQLGIQFSETEMASLNENVQLDYQIKEIDNIRIDYRHYSTSNASLITKVELLSGDILKASYTYKPSSTTLSISYIFSKGGVGGTTFTGSIPTFVFNLYNYLKTKITYISGSRYVPSSEKAEANEELTINGSNLHSFLYTIHNNAEETFEKIKMAFKQIFSEVESISTPINNSGTNISIKFIGESKLIPLHSCGSGFVHALLFLCVLFTKKNSVVLFDEPQVFLHPSAEKAIYDLIGINKEHQYLLTTHSPILINFPIEKTIYLIKKVNGRTEFSKLNKIQDILLELGINNSDYALSDKVIFVEGKTEEAVIPLILSYYEMKQIGYNYKVLKMGGTGNEFTSKSAMTRNKEKIELILSEISESPIPYRILIDRDEKSDDKIKEIADKYGDNVIILERREYENYFLDCYEEVAKIISNELESTVITDAEIKLEIAKYLSNTADRKLYPRGSIDPIKDVVGSEVLERLFINYSLRYDKVKHGIQLTQVILANSPEKLMIFKEKLNDFLMNNDVIYKTPAIIE